MASLDHSIQARSLYKTRVRGGVDPPHSRFFDLSNYYDETLRNARIALLA